MRPVLRQGNWTGREGLWVRGRIFRDNRVLDVNEVSSLLGQLMVNDRVDLDSVKTAARSLRGFFAIIWSRPSVTVLVADIVRSYPIFFSLQGRSFVVSDYLPQSHQGGIDSCSLLEFSLAGFVSGQETIWKDVFQVQAGEVVILHHKSCKIDRVPYASFVPSHPRPIKGVHTISHFVRAMDEVLSNAIARLVQHLNGRTAVIPLSGGWDSRTILLHVRFCFN